MENLYIIIGIAATKFNPEHEQLDFLIGQIIQTWNDSNFKLHDKLVGLLRIIGRDSRSNKTYTRVGLPVFRKKGELNYLIVYI